MVQVPPYPGEEGQAQEELWAWSQDAGEGKAGTGRLLGGGDRTGLEGWTGLGQVKGGDSG